MFLISFNISRTEGSTRGIPAIIIINCLYGKIQFLFLLFMKCTGKKGLTPSKATFLVQFLIVLFISYFSCAFKIIFVTSLRCALRVEGIKLFFCFHDFWLFYWDSVHKKLNNHYKIWSYQDTMKKRMKSFLKNCLKKAQKCVC